MGAYKMRTPNHRTENDAIAMTKARARLRGRRGSPRRKPFGPSGLAVVASALVRLEPAPSGHGESRLGHGAGREGARGGGSPDSADGPSGGSATMNRSSHGRAVSGKSLAEAEDELRVLGHAVRGPRRIEGQLEIGLLHAGHLERHPLDVPRDQRPGGAAHRREAVEHLRLRALDLHL